MLPIHNQMTARCRCNSITVLISLVYFIIGQALLPIHPAFCDIVAGGTVIVAVYSTDYIVIGADSRNTRHGLNVKDHTDDVCKILELSNHALFFATGDISITDGAGRKMFDGEVVAHQVYIPGLSTKDIAGRWMEIMEHRYYEQFVRFGKEQFYSVFTKSLMATGVFVDTAGGISIVGEAIRRSDKNNNPPVISHEEKIFPVTERTVHANFGIDINPELREFFQNTTERAKKIRADLNRYIEIGHLHGADVEALTTKTLIESIINWKNNEEIGGDVSVIIGEKDKPFRWFHRTEGCRN